jgi:hypothetical protein
MSSGAIFIFKKMKARVFFPGNPFWPNVMFVNLRVNRKKMESVFQF